MIHWFWNGYYKQNIKVFFDIYWTQHKNRVFVCVRCWVGCFVVAAAGANFSFLCKNCLCVSVYVYITPNIFIYFLPNLINEQTKSVRVPVDYTLKITPFIWRFDPKNYNKDVPLCFRVPKRGPLDRHHTIIICIPCLCVCVPFSLFFLTVMSVLRTQHINKGLSGLVFQNMIFVWDQVSYWAFLLLFCIFCIYVTDT